MSLSTINQLESEKKTMSQELEETRFEIYNLKNEIEEQKAKLGDEWKKIEFL